MLSPPSKLEGPPAHAGTRPPSRKPGVYDRGVSGGIPQAAVEIPQPLRARVKEKLARAAEARLGDRVRQGDATVWAPAGTPEVANRLGWLTIAQRMRDQLADMEAFAGELSAEGVRDVVLLGMGGSSLAPEVLRRTFGSRAGQPRLHVLDSTDAGAITAVERSIDAARTLFVVSSKSGGTIEPLSLFAHFFSQNEDGRRFVAITDPGSGLAELAAEHGFRRIFLGDPDIGGRYSALSPFGMLPAAVMGVELQALIDGAEAAWETPVEIDGSSGALPGPIAIGVALSALAQQGRDKLTLLIAESLPGLGLWLEQLVAESTGKQGTGILPVAEEPVAEPGAYGDDRVFAYLLDLRAPDAELDRRARALLAAGHPLITIPAREPLEVGRLFMLAEIAVAAAGWGLEINPFDQPNVQQAKDATNRVLAGFEQKGELPSIADAEHAALLALLLDAAPGEYVAIMAYLQPSDAFDAAAAELREAVRAATRATTTFGYGPRFLHSTGQFHKGGPPSGRFLQLLHDAPLDVGIPGRPYTFTTLKNAQAIGDLQTLRELGRPAERVRLQGEDPAGALRALTATIKEHT
jgi:transaldolase / glucose-6-phosphate isomerase